MAALVAVFTVVPGVASSFVFGRAWPAGAVTIPASFFTVTDTGGPNDVNAQQADLTQMGRDDSDPGTYRLFWSWDATDFTAQAGNACALFDTNGNGNIDYAVCAEIENVPSGNTTVVEQTTRSPIAVTCSDNKNDRCTNPSSPLPFTAAQIKSGDLSLAPSPPANLVTDTDPFPNLNPDQNWPNDSTIRLDIAKSFLPKDAALTNVCSYPSLGNTGNNNPFDCIVNSGGGFLQVTKVAGDTSQVFNFTVNPGAIAKSITGSGTTGALSVPIGTAYSVAETVPAGWQLDSANCVLEDLTATGTKSGSTVSGITVQSGKLTSCTFYDSLDAGALKITKTVDAGGSSFTSGSFGVHVACTNPVSSSDQTIAYPAPGFVTIPGIKSGSSCTVTETSKPTAPAGYTWATETITGSPATITGGGTADVTVANKLNLLPPDVNVDKKNDADRDSTFSDSESVPVNATYPYTVTYQLAVKNVGGAGTITSIDDVRAPNVGTGGLTLTGNTTAPGGATACADLVGQTIANNETKTCYYDVSFANADPAQVVNTATVKVTNLAAPDGLTGSDTSTVTFLPLRSIALVKTATLHSDVVGSSSQVDVGDTIEYGFDITNTGNVTLTAVDLLDALVGKDPAVACGVTTLAPGASTSCTATYTITQADIDAGTVHNTATACGTPPGEAAAEVCDTATTDTPLPAAQSIALVKTATLHSDVVGSSSQVDVGDTIEYGFDITNTGNVTLTAVDLLDALVGKDPAVACGVTTLAPGASTSCTATYTITQADIDAGTVHNTATACGTPPGEAAAEVCDTATTDTPLPAAQSIALVKTATLHSDVVGSSSQVDVGDTIEYGFDITNTGNVTLTAVDLLDALVGKDPAVACGVTTLAPGASTSCTATYTITQADIDAGTVHNTATACGTPPGEAAAEVCDTATTDTPLPAAQSIALVKTATLHSDVVGSSSQVDVGDTIEYGFDITNTGNVTLTAVDLLDALVGKDPAVACGVTTLAPGASTSCTATYTITQADIDAGTVHNTATACGTPPGEAAAEVCDTATTDTPLPAAQSIALVKTATLHSDVVGSSSQVDVGDTIEYGFDITNTGNVTLTAVDLLDALVGKDPAVACGVTTLAPGASTSCTATYTITQADIDAGTVHNTATACGTPPGETPEACDTATTDTKLPPVVVVVTPRSVQPTTTTTIAPVIAPPPGPLPFTGSSAGALAAAALVLMLTGGTMALSRRRRRLAQQ